GWSGRNCKLWQTEKPQCVALSWCPSQLTYSWKDREGLLASVAERMKVLPQEILAAETFFRGPMRLLARFLLSASDAAHFPPPSVPEVAFLGRSNVGKSSVINALVGTKLARTSSTPGRTRAINFFEIRRAGQPRADMLFTDLPGYGYAKISREVSQDWSRFVDP